MKLISLVLLLSFAMLLPGWAAEEGEKAAFYTTARLSSLIRMETLGAQLRDFERLAGPAKYIDGDARTYQVDGCAITLKLESDKSIQRLGVQASRTCRIPLNALVGGGIPPLGVATFDDFEEAGWGRAKYETDCLTGCGNASEPALYAQWTPPSSRGRAAVIAEVMIVSRPAYQAFDRWQDAVEGGGEVYMQSKRYNTDPRSQAIVRNLFKTIRISGLTLALPPHDPMGAPWNFAGSAYSVGWLNDPSTGPRGRTTPLLSTLVRKEVIGAQLAWFESLAGPGRVAGTERYYLVDGCYLDLSLDKDGDINSLGVAGSSACRVPLGRLFLPGSLGRTRFADVIETRGHTTYTVTGQGRRLTVRASWFGGHVHSWLGLDAEGTIDLDPAVYDTPAKRREAVRRAFRGIVLTRLTLRRPPI
jgi:hypothetical protein